MAEKDRKSFFEHLEEHSSIKLAVLTNYIKVWLRKILLNRSGSGSCLVVDTFAGVGLYDDGSMGSPLIIINEAIQCIRQMESMKVKIENIYLVFVEQDIEKFKFLKQNVENYLNQQLDVNKFNLINNCVNLRIALLNNNHKNFIDSLLMSVDRLVPAFFFIDPWGFCVPFELNKQLLQKYDYVELLVNVIYEELSRFIELKSISKSIRTLYGIDDVDELLDRVKGTNGKERRNTITSIYKEQLLNAGAKYTLNFDIQKSTGQYKMSLMYATKSLIGFDTMKYVLNGLSYDEGKEFEYHVDKNKGQMKLSIYPKNEILIKELADYIYIENGGKSLNSRDIRYFSMAHPYIPSSYYIKAMRLLNKEGKIIKTYRRTGISVKKNCFPDDSFVDFLPKVVE